MDDSRPDSAHKHWLQLYATGSYACSYLPQQQARSQVVAPSGAVHGDIYAQLLEKGFRRSSNATYRPWCDHCNACVPLRIPVATFAPNRSQRRSARQHGHLQARVLPLRFEPAHYALYRRYQQARHPGGSMDNDNVQEYIDFILASHVDSMLVEFRNAGVLKMVALVDRMPTALSAVYTFYADEPNASYGTYAVLWQIAHAQQHGLAHVYLGYWIAQSAKMHYKIRFQPCEVLHDGRWVVMDNALKEQLPD